MSEAYLSSLGGNSLPGLDIGQVERERKEMWRKMFQKYEDMEEREESADEIAVEDIDKDVPLMRTRTVTSLDL